MFSFHPLSSNPMEWYYTSRFTGEKIDFRRRLTCSRPHSKQDAGLGPARVWPMPERELKATTFCYSCSHSASELAEPPLGATRFNLLPDGESPENLRQRSFPGQFQCPQVWGAHCLLGRPLVVAQCSLPQNSFIYCNSHLRISFH